VAEHGVVIAGGGPTGLMLAAELALARVDVAIVERRPTQDVVGSRSGGLQSRTIEILDQRGVADRFLSQGQIFRVASFAHVSFDRGELPSRHNYGLALRQSRFEEILAGWVGELEVPIYRGRELTDFAQRRGGVDVESPAASRCARSTSSAATADAASCARPPASTSPVGTRRSAR
jgi:2-polyprenyl-6-methoxyphenol hydroxylase-like FAD-dependent oxidoreductase